MSFAADLDRAVLSVALDLRHPLAYLALGPARAFARQRGLVVNWLPLAAQPLHAPSEPGPDDDRGIRHRRHRAHAIGREIETYAGTQGLVLEQPYRAPSPEAAHAAWLWMRAEHPDELEPFLDALFRSYWAVELDPADARAVAEVVRASGGDPDAFQAWQLRDGAAALDSVASELQSFGLFQVPAFVIDDEVFYGRQHLPMIEWILDGRSGPVPI